MRKKLLSVLLASIMALSLCVVPASADGPITITIPTYYVGENVGAVYFEPAVERFNEQNEGKYEVKLEEVVESSYADKISQLAQTGDIPILISGITKEMMETVLIPRNLYYPMNDFLDEHPEIADLCLDASVEYCTLDNGDIVSVPIVTVSNMGIYYNSDLYSPDGNVCDMTMDEFLDSLGDNKIAFQTVDNAWTTMLFYSALVANEDGGAEILQSYDGEVCYDFTDVAFVNAAQELVDIWDKYAANNSLGAAYADAANGFMSDASAVIFNGSWMNSEFSPDSSGNWSNDFDGANVVSDYFPGNVALGSEVGYGRWIMTNNGTDDELECAQAFLAFLYSQDELEQFALTEGCQIPNMTYSDDFLDALNQDPLVARQTELVTGETKIVPTVADIMVTSVADSVFANDLVQLVNGAITPEQFCQDLTTKSKESADD